MRENDASLVLTVPEAAAMLGLSVRSTYTLCRRADFPAVRLTPNRIGVSRAGLLEGNTVTAYWGHYFGNDRDAAVRDFDARGD